MTWLAIKALGLPRWMWGAIAVLSLLLAHMWFTDSREDKAEDRGRVIERADQQAKAIETAEKVNEAREQAAQDIRAGGGPELYANCLRSARNPEACKRFLP